tara:strand:+ start:1404 stop:4019 length:2616 start_codon:yes stop_codon:yes gene_type:complete
MKNKILRFLITIFVFNIATSNTIAEIQFNFDVTNVEILDNGNVFKGSNRGIITTDDGIVINGNSFEYTKDLNILKVIGDVKIEDTIQNYIIYAENATYLKNKELIITKQNSKGIDGKGKIITADSFSYNKKLNILNAKGDVKINDTIQNYIIFAEDITYLKNQEKIFTKGLTKSIIKSKYNIESKNIIFLLNEGELSSDRKTIIKDTDSHVYYLDKFFYSINDEKLKGENIIIITNFGLPKSDKFYFSNAIINLENKNFIAKDTKVEIHQDVFGNKDNDPRLKGVSSRKDNNIITIKKGVFTSCSENEKCPPWSIKAQKIRHDKIKKQLIYDNAFVRVYDFPIFYFPKFFHPDPTVKRQSGLLRPQLNNSNILGNSVTIPYYFVAANNKDYTFTSSIFDKNIQMFQTEFRQINKNSRLLTDLSFTKGYKSSLTGKKKNISHLFGKFDLDLDFEQFESSGLSLSLEKVTNDTYLKVFESNITNSDVRPQNFDVLNNELKFRFDHKDYDLTTGFEAYENLQLKNSDRYHYILPYYIFNKNLTQNFLHGSIDLISNGKNELKNTNNLRSTLTNDISYRGFDLVTNFGLVNNLNINFKNLNSSGKNDTEYKSNLQVEAMSNYEFISSLPLNKKDDKFEQFLTPKLSLRFSPNDMKNSSSKEKKVDVNNIFANNRLGLDSSFEAGRSLTVGFDYKKEGLNDINKYFDLKLATVFRDKEENFLPKVSTLNRKTSNIFGSISTNFSEYLNVYYNFAVDNDLKTFERNSVMTSLSVNNFVTKFNFIEENGEMGDINSINNSTSYKIDDNNYLTFNTRRNRKLNLTEYYDLVYEYKNDCLTAGIKYKKTYYQDRDIKPTENLMFTITLFPLTTLEQKIDQ